MKLITDPAAALKEVGTENSQLHEELARLYGEVDGYRNALTVISRMTGHFERAVRIAANALAGRKIDA
jgi:hypothetical protein